MSHTSSLNEVLRSAYPKLDIVKSILSSNSHEISSTRPDGSSALHVACFNSSALSDKDLISLLIDAQPILLHSPNKFGHIPLHKAVCVASSDSHLETIALITKRHPQGMLAQTIDGQTPLHLALSYPKVPYDSLIKKMVCAEPRVLSSIDKYGQTPLHIAAAKSKISIDTIQFLMQSFPAALSMQDFQGYVFKSISYVMALTLTR